MRVVKSWLRSRRAEIDREDADVVLAEIFDELRRLMQRGEPAAIEREAP
jgi:hypothetical protein